MYAALFLALTPLHADDADFLANVPILVLDGETAQTRQARKTSSAFTQSKRLQETWYPVNVEIHKNLLLAAAREGLPLIPASRARLDVGSAATMQQLSRQLRALGFTSTSPEDSPLADKTVSEKAEILTQWGTSAHLEKFRGTPATLWQMLQIEEEPLRLTMVDFLSRSPSASTFLAKCAIYDSSPKVRELSVKALHKRPAAGYLPTLLAGVQHPWPAARENAVQAIQKLKPSGVQSTLQKLLEESPPGVPYKDKRTGKFLVRELVRLNHRQNCLLCHEPAYDQKSGLVQPDKNDGYYDGRFFIRADVTYLRPDFSVMIDTKTKRHGLQRYDFLIRTRPATDLEISKTKQTPEPGPPRRQDLERLLKTLREGD
jgi:hypothetical protein